MQNCVKSCLHLGLVGLAMIVWDSLANSAEINLPKPVMQASFESSPDGIGKNGEIKGTATSIDYCPGKIGQAARFTIQGHSHIKYDGAIINPDAGTIAAWIKLDHPSNHKIVRTFLNIGGPTKGLEGESITFNPDALIFPNICLKGINWPEEQWHHLAFSWKPNHASEDFPYRYDVAVYLDGKGMARRTVNHRPVPVATITLGAYPVPEYGRPQLFELEGAIDEFLVYDVGLTPAQIAVLSGYSPKEAVTSPLPPLETPFPPCNYAGTKTTFLQGNGEQTIIDPETPAEIIIGDQPGNNDSLAAQELQKYIAKITGRIIPINKTAAVSDSVKLYLGAAAAKLAGAKAAEPFAVDEIYISMNKNAGILTGDMESGSLNAVYALLEHFGVRWYSAGDEGEFVPQKSRLLIPHGEWRYAPFFQMRRIQLAGPVDYNSNITLQDLNHWTRRNKMQLGTYSQFHRMVAPHLAKIIPEKEFTDHPEYFALNEQGKRSVPSQNNLNPCTSNPEVIKKIQEKAVQLLQENPQAMYFSIEPIDGGGWCLCPNCLKMDVVPGNYTDRVVILANHITQAIEAAFPGAGKAARFFAYQGYSNLPEKSTALGNLQVEVTKGTPELIAGWAKYVKNLQRWDYNGWNSFKWGPMPLSILPEKIQLLKNNHYTGGLFDEGVASVLSLGQPFYYIEAKLMWNPEADLKELLSDFFANYYGQAGELMRNCFDLLETETRNAKSSLDMHIEYSKIQFQPHIYSPAVWKQCLEWSRQAEQLVLDDPVRLHRVQTTRMTYLFSDVARDAIIAKQYLPDKQHPFWQYINSSRELNTSKLLEAIQLARSLGFKQVRGNTEPGSLEAIVASWANPLQIDITAFQKIFNPVQKQPAEAQKTTWRLVFKDTFEREELGANWKIIRGNWSVKDGCLTGRGDAIYINKKFPGDQRLVFDAWVNHDQTPCDLDGILSDASMSGYGIEGYLFAFGTWGNNFSKINRNKMQIQKIALPVIELGKRHHIVCEKEGSALRWWIDGKLVAEYQEPFQTLKGEYIGFYIDSAGQIDNVEVYTKNQ